MAKRRSTSKSGRVKPAAFFREWRLHRALTQERAAERAEMSTASISQLESGVQGFSDQTLAALAHAYDCEIADLFRDPTRPDYQLWRIISNLKPDQQSQAMAVIKALAEHAA